MSKDVGCMIFDLLERESCLSDTEIRYLMASDVKLIAGRAFTREQKDKIHELWKHYCGRKG